MQHQDARTGENSAEEPFSEKKKHKKKLSALKLEELQKHRFEDEILHKRNAIEHKTKKKMKKKKKKRDSMDVDARADREIQRVQEQQEEDQFTRDEKLRAEKENGDRKKSKMKKEKKKEDRHSNEGNLCRENKREKKTSKKKENKRKEEEEKAGTPSLKIITVSSSADHELRKERKALKLVKKNGTGGDVFEGVANAKGKMARKAKQTQDILCELGGEVGSSRSVKGDESDSSKAWKHSKKSGKSEEKRCNEDHDLSSNNIECNEGPLADQLEHATNTHMSIDSSPKEKEKGKKKIKKRKRVTFQEEINVTGQQHVRDIPNAASENSTDIVEEVWRERFTVEEDEILKQAVSMYIKSKGWDEQEGLNKVFNSMKHKDARNCWGDIKQSLPHRPRQAIRYRAHLLLEKGAHEGKWSEEEEKILKRLQEKHGRKWRKFSDVLDRHRTSIKEKWRSLKRMKATGVWTQGELQQLSDMVHKCLRAKTSIPVKNKKPNHQILRDEINWEKIADSIGTHNHGSCCSKWYYNLQSSLVADGHWANEDDTLLLQSLLESGACAEEEVEWDSLLNHRSGQVCLMRWKQMVKQLGENRTQQFLAKLDILACRYAPELLENTTEEISIENNSIQQNPSGSTKIND